MAGPSSSLSRPRSISSGRRHRRVWKQRAVLAANLGFFLILSWTIKDSLLKSPAPVEIREYSEERIVQTPTEHVLKPVFNSHRIPVALASAFRDPRTPDVIVTHLITSNAIEMLTLFCHFRHGNETLYTVNAEPPMTTEQYKPRYFTFFFHCPLWYPALDHNVTHVAISDHHTDVGSLGVEIVNLNKSGAARQSLCACVGPTARWEFTREDVVAWIELSRLLGVGHFVFYNHSIPAAHGDIFRYYRSLGVASILHWRLHLPEKHESAHAKRTLGKLPLHAADNAYNDCLYRTAATCRYAVMLEPDELIIPSSHFRIDDLLDALESTGDGHHAFRFDVVYLPSDEYQEPLVEKSNVYFLQKSKILTFPDPDDQLSAFVVKPGDSGEVKAAAVHRHENTTRRAGILRVDPQLATVRRYRQFFEEMNHPECRIRTDNRLPVYVPKLVKVTSSVLQQLEMKSARDRPRAL